MERRGVSSDRGNQLRQVRTDNVQRKAEVVDIGRLRSQLAQRQEEEASRRREAEQRKLLGEVEAVFRGHGPINREATLRHWRYLATQEVPDVENARALWERDEWDADAKAWRETVQTIKWETGQVARSAQAIEDWHQKHLVQSLALRKGLVKVPRELQRLEETYAQNARFLAGSQRRLAELEQAWPKKRLVYQQQLEREGEAIRNAKRYLGVIESNRHWQKFWEREDATRRRRGSEDRRSRDGDRNRGGWSR